MIMYYSNHCHTDCADAPCGYVLCINYSQSVGDLQANAIGVMNQLARIMQAPNIGMMGSVPQICTIIILTPYRLFESYIHHVATVNIPPKMAASSVISV